MKNFLEKIGLIQYTTLKLSMEKFQFIEKLKPNVTASDLNWNSSFFEMYDGTDYNYKGTITPHRFKIRKRLKVFQDRFSGMPVAHGKLKQEEDNLLIKIQFFNFKNILLFLLFFIIPFYMITLRFFFSNESVEDFIPLLIFYGILLIVLPFTFAKKGVDELKKELERDLLAFTTNN